MRQAIAWIDEREAQILRLEDGIHCDQTIAAPEGTPASPGESDVFFAEVAAALKTAGEILVVGPSEIKKDFVKYMHKKDHGFDTRILGVETVEHPKDHQLVGYANRYFTEGGPRRSGHGSGYKEPD